MRGHGAEAHRPADGAGGLRASPQGLHAASSGAADQTAGRERLQKLGECLTGLLLAQTVYGFYYSSLSNLSFAPIFGACFLKSVMI